jgi:aspartate racemase
MRVIGLIGGMSWVSTSHYYRLLNQDVAQRLGGDHCARLVLWQTDFAEITAMQRADEWALAGELLAAGGRALVAAGAEVIGIGANTMHLVAEPVRAAVDPAHLVHIVEVVRDECLERGITRLGLFGTAYTMESPTLYPPLLAAASIEVIVPDADDRAEIQRITFEELIRDEVTDASRVTFHTAAARLLDKGAEAVVLACTEHGMLLADGDLGDAAVLDSTALHARALVDAALA